MSPIEILIAFVPLALYLGAIGVTPLFRRPVVYSGSSDLFFLLLGVGGLILVGPVKLLFPIGALIVWKWLVFPLVLSLYILISILVAGLRHSQIVVYNVREEDFQAFLAELTEKSEVQISGNCVQIPKIDVQFSYEHQPFWRCLVLKSTSNDQSLPGWAQLERILREKLAAYRTPLAVKNLLFPVVAISLMSFAVWNVVQLIQDWLA